MAWQPRETLRRTIVNASGEHLGLHRGLGGEHRAPGQRRRRNPWLAFVGPGLAGLVIAGSIVLALTGFGQRPHGKIPPQVLPAIVGTVLPSSGPAASASSYPARSTTQSPADRTAGTTTPAPTGDVLEMAGAPVPALSPTPAASTAAADAPPPLPPPLPPVATSTPPVCPPLPTPGKSKKPKEPEPTRSRGHW